ncbi:PREDICTED: 28S ribosomal protein S22, mitochondrial [Atta cephalotes]|uniref:28S ribosomal protein S22, mitochondrial n=1 Tax=Atta cephalotes TaxID=12957 RepID=A0A158NRQ1_ATTCE|nr:PREDICTED: 28S ribosomal protein S22, mitochondrial [Atta cephalotes]
MLSHHISKLLRRSYSRTILNYRGFASTNVEPDPMERDPASFFFNKEIQECLQTLTTLDYNKVFRTRKDGHKQELPQFKFLTDEQLEEARKEAEHRAKKYLQMPPVVKQRVEPSELLCEDPALQSHDTAKYVFTDITYGLKDKQRSIVVRELDGTLRHASWKERDRMIQIFLPKPERELQKPKMFEGEYFKDLLNRNEYEFILDRACTQFEPDDPDYQAVTQEVYEHINAKSHFDVLRSTRHFGPMVFHLVWTSNIDNLLYEMIETNRIKDAALLIRLYYMVHPTTKSAVEQCENTDDVNFVMHYVRLESLKKDKIQKLLQSYKELQQEREIVAEGIKQAHGISSETDKT